MTVATSLRSPRVRDPDGVGASKRSRSLPLSFPGCGQYWPVCSDAKCKTASTTALYRHPPATGSTGLRPDKGERHDTTFRVFRYSRVNRGPAGNNTRCPCTTTWHRAQSETADRAVAQEADRESGPGAGSSAPSRKPPLGE